MKPIVFELSEPYTNIMLNPAPYSADGICGTCATFTDGYAECYPCANSMAYLDAVLPITYSVHLGQMHSVLNQYKRSASVRTRRNLQNQVAAVLYRFLDGHEACLAGAVGLEEFDVVTIVPSSVAGAGASPHPLERIVGAVIPSTRDRYEPILRRTDIQVAPRTTTPDKFAATVELAGRNVLLIDDTWTSGANAQSAAAALKTSGAGVVAAVPIGRHVRPGYLENRARLDELDSTFDWDVCAIELAAEG